MSTFKFEGDPEQGGLPRGSMVRVEEAMGKAVVFEGKVNKAAYLELDPGKYLYSVVRLTERAEDGTRDIEDCRYDGEFLHEVTEQAWNELKTMKPRLARVTNTSEGARWKCLVSGCKDGEAMTSPVSALIHEVVDHLNIPYEDFLASPRAKARLVNGGKYERLATDASKAKNAPASKRAVLGEPDRDEE